MEKKTTQVPIQRLNDIVPLNNLPTSPNASASLDDRRASARAVDHHGVAELVGELAITLDRAHEFPGKLLDARRLKRRLVLRAAGLDQQIATCERELTLAREKGRRFVERKVLAQIRALEDERADTVALLGEVARVFQRLRREQRTLSYRLDCGEALVAAIPAKASRDAVHALFAEARRCLATPHLESDAGVEA